MRPSWRGLGRDRGQRMQWNGWRGALTIWRVSGEAAPTAMGHLDEADLDLDFADSVVGFGRVDLAFEGLEDEGLVSVGVGELEWRGRYGVDGGAAGGGPCGAR